MYAVVKTGGKQYRVSKDDKIMVESIKAEPGSTVYLDKVILLDNKGSITVGTPTVQGAIVSAEVLKQARGPKIIVFRRKRRKNHRRIQGHRQNLTLLKILDISPDGKTKAAIKKTTRAADKTGGETKAAIKKTTRAADKTGGETKAKNQKVVSKKTAPKK